MIDPTVERFLPGLGAESCKTATGVAYVRHGAGEPLVLFHGGSGSWSHWVRNVAALGAGFRVHAFDQPGYGASDDVDAEISNDAYIDLIVRSIAEATGGAERVHVAGFSFGGSVAAAVAARLGARAAALSLVGTAGFERPDRRNLPMVSTRRQREELGRQPTMAELRALHRSNLGVLMVWDKAKIDELAVDTQVENVARTRFNSRRFSWSGLTPTWLGEASCPVSIIYGEHDASAYPSVADRVAQCRASRPDAKHVLIRDCGHWAMYEAPETVNAEMLAFHGSV
jgi:2-hydroxy-6-oxonona-2,4-dienedioate hydrolase